MLEECVKLGGRTAWFLGLQLTIACVVARAAMTAASGVRRLADRRRSLAVLASALVPVSLVTGVLGGMAWIVWGRPWPVEPRVAVLPGAVALAGAWGTAGVYRMLAAGRLERRGARRPAKRLARHAGLGAFAGGCLVLALLALSRPQLDVAPSGPADGPMRLAGLTLIAVGGIAELLAGLSGKPRPSGAFAAAAWVVGWTLVVAATPFPA